MRTSVVVNPSPQYGGETVVDNVPGASEAWKKLYGGCTALGGSAERLFAAKPGNERLFSGPRLRRKKAKLARISYAKFLTEMVGVDPQVVKVYQAAPHPLFGVGIDAVAAQDAWGLGLPGFAGMKLDPAPGKGMNRDAIRNEEADRYFFHFPDGNASIARLIVRQLIPNAIPGSSCR